jgi:hypothetical protein
MWSHTLYGEVSRLVIKDGESLTVRTTCDTENIFVTGSATALGNWSPNEAVPLSPGDYPTWKGAYQSLAQTVRLTFSYLSQRRSTSRRAPKSSTNTFGSSMVRSHGRLIPTIISPHLLADRPARMTSGSGNDGIAYHCCSVHHYDCLAEYYGMVMRVGQCTTTNGVLVWLIG